MIRIFAILSLAALFGAASAQSPDKPPPSGVKSKSEKKPVEKSDLEKAIEQALTNNPDLRVAQAKLQEADALLHRARLEVIQKVVTTRQAIENAEQQFTLAVHRRADVGARIQQGQASRTEMVESESAVQTAQANLTTAKAELDYLTGKSTAGTLLSSSVFGIAPAGGFGRGYLSTQQPDGTSRLVPVVTGSNPFGGMLYRDRMFNEFNAPSMLEAYSTLAAKAKEGPATDRLRKQLERKVTLNLENKTAREILATIRTQVPDLTIQAPEKGSGWDAKATLQPTTISLVAALQLLEDVHGECVVLVREYGLLIAPANAIPPRAVTLSDFLRATAKDDEPKSPSKPASPPAR